MSEEDERSLFKAEFILRFEFSQTFLIITFIARG